MSAQATSMNANHRPNLDPTAPAAAANSSATTPPVIASTADQVGGPDRQANAALYRIVLIRLRDHRPTRNYVVRRLAEGKSKQEIIRCLKRYVAREVFTVLRELQATDPTTPG